MHFQGRHAKHQVLYNIFSIYVEIVRLGARERKKKRRVHALRGEADGKRRSIELFKGDEE